MKGSVIMLDIGDDFIITSGHIWNGYFRFIIENDGIYYRKVYYSLQTVPFIYFKGNIYSISKY